MPMLLGRALLRLVLRLGEGGAVADQQFCFGPELIDAVGLAGMTQEGRGVLVESRRPVRIGEGEWGGGLGLVMSVFMVKHE